MIMADSLAVVAVQPPELGTYMYIRIYLCTVLPHRSLRGIQVIILLLRLECFVEQVGQHRH